MGILEIGRDQTAIALLTGSVPHLQSVMHAITFNIFHIEIDTDSGLPV